jgi:hypothetical protein
MLTRGRTLIRKTSLLRKIEPIARRSSFANKDHSQPAHLAMNERRNDLEIVIEYPRIASQIPNSDRSPLYDVRYPARRVHPDSACEVMFSRTTISKGPSPSSLLELRRGQPSLRFGSPSRSWRSQRRLVEPDGIEPTTSCLQSTRSPS